jgi:hypothetical protein
MLYRSELAILESVSKEVLKARKLSKKIRQARKSLRQQGYIVVANETQVYKHKLTGKAVRIGKNGVVKPVKKFTEQIGYVGRRARPQHEGRGPSDPRVSLSDKIANRADYWHDKGTISDYDHGRVMRLLKRRKKKDAIYALIQAFKDNPKWVRNQEMPGDIAALYRDEHFGYA